MGSASVDKLVPELATWDLGNGISLTDWIYIVGRADHALGFQALLWPRLAEFEGYVLRESVDVERLREWEASGATRSQIETAMNALFLDAAFPNDETADPLKNQQMEALASIMCEMLRAKLNADFPTRKFEVFLMEGEDFGVSFRQS
jgi:hypothetical protein